ncbi:uncharacterized protein METZ01_LOCUS383756, partial [marine metagenome]
MSSGATKIGDLDVLPGWDLGGLF